MGRATTAYEKRKLERKLKYQKKREEENSILSKANELLSQEREKSAEEIQTLKLAEQIKADKAKKSDRDKQHRKEKLLKITPEEKKALFLKLAETAKRNHKIKREKEESILSQAVELQGLRRELSSEERDILKQAEQIKAKKLKRCEDSKRLYRQKRDSVAEEEKEALKQKRIEQRQKLSVEEKQAISLEKSKRQKRYWTKYRKREESILTKAAAILSQNQELSSDDKEVLRLAEEVKADRLRKLEIRKELHQRRIASISAEKRNDLKLEASVKQRQYYEKWLSSMTPEKLKCYRLMKTEQARQFYRNRKFMRHRKRIEKINTSKQDEYKTKNAAGWLKKDEITSNFPLVVDDIKIEAEELQESNIKTIAASPILDIRQKGIGDSPHSSLEISENSFTKGGRMCRSHRYFQTIYEGSSSLSESFENIYGHLKNINRISALEDSFHCMRVLLDATSKRCGLTLFGENIAQKLRNCGKDAAEVSIAKQLIDNVLQNLLIGAYSFENKIV